MSFCHAKFKVDLVLVFYFKPYITLVLCKVVANYLLLYCSKHCYLVYVSQVFLALQTNFILT